MSAFDLHSGYQHATSRAWHASDASLGREHLMLPLFVSNGTEREPVSSLPGVERVPAADIVDYARPLVARGVQAVLLFGVMTDGKAARFGWRVGWKSPLYCCLFFEIVYVYWCFYTLTRVRVFV